MSHSRCLRLSKLTLGLVVALAAAPVFAQSTSAGVGGMVTNVSGQPVTGAEVTITHVESGTVSRATTDASGRYNARGLRVGGPYTITITKSGEGTRTEDGVYLNLNQVNQVNAALEGDLTTLDAVQAVAVGGSEIFSSTKMGTGINVTRESIEALPSANRNIQDYIRLDPRISQVSKADGAISAGGQNTRYNVIRIDGISASDPFGLESNNLPTERQPVSMDAIQEINIDLANYDTTISGGTGAVVNAVTKSGTNEFHGTVYGTYRDKSWFRKELENKQRPDQPLVFDGFNNEKTYGLTFGGPIIKDKLFFFANYEKYIRDGAATSFADTPYGSGKITDADIAAIQKASADKGFDAGTLNLPKIKSETEEYALKIDWNINESHRASFRYSKSDQVNPRFPSISSSAVSLSSYWFDLPKTYTSYMSELYSDWNDSFSTELKASYKDYKTSRDTYSHLPSIQIKYGNNSVYLGTENNSHVNNISTKELSLFGAGTWYAGDHTVKFGFDHTKNDIVNFYGRNLNGTYVFNSFSDFVNGKINNFQLRVPTEGGSIKDIPAEYTLKNTGLFVQDTWAINYNLSVMFGIRLDIPSFSDQRLYNPRIQELYGYNNTNTVDSKLFQPRVGFNYTFDSDRPTQLRGGVGLFGGAAPNVWLAGTYQNTGFNYLEYNVNNPNIAFSPDINNQPRPGSGVVGRQNVDIAEPGLRMPSVWKANLAFDHELPWHGIVASAEILMTKVKDGIYFERLDIMDPTAVGQDGRAIYWNTAGLNTKNSDINSSGVNYGISNGKNGASNRANRPGDIGDVLLMRNTNKGGSNQFTVGLDKPLTDMWGWSAAYTFTTAKEVSPLSSSQNTSNWNNTLITQANENVSYNSRYAIRDRITATLQWQKAFFGDYKTRIGMFYEGRSGRPFSYIFYNDANGDSAGTNDLFYVPNGPGDVLWTGGAEMEKNFFDWLDRNPELKRFSGNVASANAFRSQWTNSFDVRISQDLPGFMQGHKSEIALDIMNFGNLLNKKWGLIEDYGFYSTRRVANYAGIDKETGKYIYSFTGSTDEASIQENNSDKGNTGVSRWSIMLSLKYKF